MVLLSTAGAGSTPLLNPDWPDCQAALNHRFALLIATRHARLAVGLLFLALFIIELISFDFI